jgi:hypothetical protein
MVSVRFQRRFTESAVYFYDENQSIKKTTDKERRF